MTESVEHIKKLLEEREEPLPLQYIAPVEDVGVAADVATGSVLIQIVASLPRGQTVETRVPIPSDLESVAAMLDYNPVVPLIPARIQLEEEDARFLIGRLQEAVAELARNTSKES